MHLAINEIVMKEPWQWWNSYERTLGSDEIVMKEP